MNITTGTALGKTYTTEVPDELIFIYSKHVYFRAHIEGGAGVQIRLNIASHDNSISHDELRYADSEGRVTFDIARVLQMLTDSREKEMSSLMYDVNDNTPWNMPSWNISLIWNADTMSVQLSQLFTTFVLVNGAHDNAYDWRNTPRVENATRLKWWTEYPFTMDFINTDKIDVRQYGVRELIDIVKLPADSVYQMIRLNPVGLNITADRATILPNTNIGLTIIDGELYDNKRNVVTLDVDRCHRSDRKTYLRWLGSHGEVFYWLFDNVTEDISVKSETYSRAMADNEFRGLVTNRMRGNGLIRHSEQTRTRNIATEYLDNGYYDIVQSVASSPCVDMLIGDGNSEKWQRVNVSDASFSRSLKTADRAKRHRIVLTIEISEL
jgi:hypothetical protein